LRSPTTDALPHPGARRRGFYVLLLTTRRAVEATTVEALCARRSANPSSSGCSGVRRLVLWRSPRVLGAYQLAPRSPPCRSAIACAAARVVSCTRRRPPLHAHESPTQAAEAAAGSESESDAGACVTIHKPCPCCSHASRLHLAQIAAPRRHAAACSSVHAPCVRARRRMCICV
jgi:hypothetical protein